MPTRADIAAASALAVLAKAHEQDTSHIYDHWLKSPYECDTCRALREIHDYLNEKD